MRVLFVLEYFPPHIGGVETLFDKLTEALASEGNDVTILTSKAMKAKKYEMSKGRRIYRINVPFRHAFILAFKKAAKLAENVDIVHTSTYVATGTTWLMKKLKRKPVIATFHEIWGRLFFEFFQNPISAFVNYSLEDFMCKVYKNEILTCPSVATEKAMVEKGIPKKNIHVIPHGIDYEVFNKRVKPFKVWGHPTYLFFGRPGLSKGLEYLIEAVPRIKGRVPGSKLLLMMSKTDRYHKILRKIKSLGIDDDVILIEPKPTRREVASVIKSADVVVVPSLSEGFGFSAVEAQACGVPVVASNAASLPEVVKGGILVPPRDSKAIAHAVERLLKDKKLASRTGTKGSEFVKRFTWERSVEAYLKLYEKSIINP